MKRDEAIRDLVRARELANDGLRKARHHLQSFALVILLVIRPITGPIGLSGHRADRSEKVMLAVFGIRGVGSINYLAYGLNHIHVARAERLWGLNGLVVLFSIVLHGLTGTPIMRLLDLQHGRDPDKNAPPVVGA